MIRKLTVLMLALVMMLSAMSIPSFADGEDEPVGKDVIAGTVIPFGLYEPTETELYDSGRVKILCRRVHVTHTITAEITFTSTKYTKAWIGETEYAPYVDTVAGETTFMLPIELGERLEFTAHTTAMSGQDITYGDDEDLIVNLDFEDPEPAERKDLADGYYTSTVNTRKALYGWKINKGKLQEGFSYPSKDYEFPVTVKIEDGEIADVAYTQDIYDISANTGSDVNYLMWAMNGHYVSDKCYSSKTVSGCETYNISPVPDSNGEGLKEQLVEAGDIDGVDTVSAATLTSRAIISAVDEDLTKAERGDKDDPDPELPGPDTTPDVVPEDGWYTAKGTAIGTDLDEDKRILLHVVDGVINIEHLYVQEREASYPYFFCGTEAEALEAGEANWPKPVAYDYGYKYSGSIYRGYVIKSLDKPQLFQMKAKSSDTWFNRPVTIKSEDITAITADEAMALKNAALKDTEIWNAKEAVQNAEALDTTYNTEETKTDLANAIQAVRDAAASETTTADDIKTAIGSLNIIVKDAKAEAVVREKEEAVTEANTAIEGAKAYMGAKADYTAESYEAFETALTALNEALANEDATAAQIRDAKAALDEAVSNLVVMKEQKLTVKPAKKTYRVKALKKSKKVFKAVKVKGNQGKLSYTAKATGKSRKVLKFNKTTGKITVKKGTKKGKYTMTITVKAAKTSLYKAASKKVKVVVTVKK